MALHSYYQSLSRLFASCREMFRSWENMNEAMESGTRGYGSSGYADARRTVLIGVRDLNVTPKPSGWSAAQDTALAEFLGRLALSTASSDSISLAAWKPINDSARTMLQSGIGFIMETPSGRRIHLDDCGCTPERIEEAVIALDQAEAICLAGTATPRRVCGAVELAPDDDPGAETRTCVLYHGHAGDHKDGMGETVTPRALPSRPPAPIAEAATLATL